MAIVLSDIIKVAIPEETIQEAHEFAVAMRAKSGSDRHRPLNSIHDEVGYCGHWAVEQVLDGWGIPYESTRTQIYTGGDLFDLDIMGQKVDIKCTSIGRYNEDYFYNHSFYILKDWTDSEKSDLISDYIMVHIERDLSEARIFGVVNRQSLLECPIIGPCESPITLRFANYHLKSRQLDSLYKYIFRT